MNEEIQSGGCLCGKISYQFNKSEAISAHHCHCLDCQKSTGSGKATILLVPDSSLEIDGNLKFFTVQGSGGSHISRGFCENCGSPLISFVEENADIKFIKVAFAILCATSKNDLSFLTLYNSANPLKIIPWL